MILIYGKGKTGQSVYKFCKENSIDCIILDDADFDVSALDKIKEIVISPGIPFYHQVYKEAKKRKIPVISDIEFAYRFFKGKIIAITGTDGKTTTTTLVYEILKNAGLDVHIGGNYGIPFIDFVKHSDKSSIAVLELSSFQLYSTKNFKPDIAVILNIDKDHLDWHKKLKHYILSKLKITKNQTKEDLLIINENLKPCVKTNAKLETVNLNKFLSEENLKIKSVKIPLNEIKLKGNHNLENIVFASIVSLNLNIDPEIIKNTVVNFSPLAHRLEFVKKINEVSFYNDSKSTTVQATIKAVESFENPVILILGGIDKGGDFSKLNFYKNKIKSIFIIGKDREKIKKQINLENVFLKDTLEDAVKKAYITAEKEDVILFSPACASFDMFKNYVDRGEKFKKIVESLNEKIQV
jgi:UDP-N-acetylmuramoylalanine--D-glutamate ligase